MTATVVLPRERVVVPDGPLAVPFDARGVVELFDLDRDAADVVSGLYAGGDVVTLPEQRVGALVDCGLVVEERDGLHAVPLDEAIERGWQWREREAEVLFRRTQADAEQQWNLIAAADSSAQRTVLHGDSPALNERLYDVQLQAHDVFSAFPPLSPGWLRAETLTLADTAALVRMAEATCHRGVRTRAVYDADRLVQLNQRRIIDAHAHLQSYRQLAGRVALRMVVVDDYLTLLPADGRQPGSGIMFVESREVAALARQLVERSLDRHIHAVFLDCDVDPDRRRLVTLLGAGHTDEVIARRLGVSDRTVRRMVADLMREHGAQSRFQLALRLREAGVL